MKISTRGHYAVQALVDMACQPQGAPAPLGLIARRQGLSQNYLEQLFVKLRKAQLVQSVRGPGGGYLLAHAPSGITIGAVFAAVDESLVFIECAHDNKADSRTPCDKAGDCRTQMLWSKLCKHFNELLFAITIDDVAKGTIELEPGTVSTAL